MREIAIRQPDDFHGIFAMALRWNGIRLPRRARSRALVMPNTKSPIRTGEQALAYKRDIMDALLPEPKIVFEPLMTIMLMPETTSETIVRAKECGVVAAKLYPRGATTQSAHGVVLSELHELRDVFASMREVGMALSIHGEDPETSILERERNFLPFLDRLVRNVPDLRIVMEHLTTRETIQRVSSLPPNIAGTITVHHLFLTIDDVIGGRIRPHTFCLPVAKTAEDRRVLRETAMSTNPKFFFGSDSASHAVSAKKSDEGPPGIFTAPVALQLLAQVFDEHGLLDRLEDFVSRNGAEFYGLPLNQGTITLAKKRWCISDTWGNARTFNCKEPLH